MDAFLIESSVTLLPVKRIFYTVPKKPMDTEVCKASLRLGKDSGLGVAHVVLFTRDVGGGAR